MKRRDALRALAAGTAVAAVASPTRLVTGAKAAAADIPGGANLTNQGVGVYTDLSVASQMSTFTINPTMVSCGVGTFGALGMSGPFTMVMYSTDIQAYDTNSGARTITASGRMRSITMVVAGIIQENIDHDFVAIARDNGGTPAKDRFDIHFRTPFWNPNNPIATRSDLRSDWVKFGGDVATGLVLLNDAQLGGVNVS